MRVKSRRGTLFLLLLLVMALVAAACGGDDDDGGETGSATSAAEDGGTEGDDAASEDPAYADLVAAAQEEGGVTIYSSQGLDALNAFGEAFEERYDVPVEVVRGIDTELSSRVETELETGGGPDLYVSASQPWVEAHTDAFAEPTSPQLTGAGDYDADTYVHDGNFFEVGAALLTMAWNTSEVDDLTAYEDLLDPQFAGGKLGVIEPAAPSIVDFYLWMEETFGEEYVEQLAAQEPRIYPSALPIGEALISGEIFASPYAAPVQLVPAQESGAPVDFAIDERGAWGARYFGMIMNDAEHPNAAQLLADFMVTAEGQQLVVGVASSVLPDVPGALLTNEEVRQQDLDALTPEAVAAYQEKWNSLFR